MKMERFLERIADLKAAFVRLEEVLAMEENDVVRDSIIQRFEFTYELAWKAAKLWLESKDIDVRNAKDTWEAALLQGVIDDGNGWSRLHEMRNLTSHTYNEKTAKDVVGFVRHSGRGLFAAFVQRLDALAQKL